MTPPPPPPPLKLLNRICIDLKNDPNGSEKNGFPLKNGKIPCLCYPVNKFDNVAATSGNFEEIKYFRHATS